MNHVDDEHDLRNLKKLKYLIEKLKFKWNCCPYHAAPFLVLIFFKALLSSIFRSLSTF